MLSSHLTAQHNTVSTVSTVSTQHMAQQRTVASTAQHTAQGKPVHSMPLIAGSTELDELCRTSYQRRKTGIVVKLKILSDRGLQVDDPKASGTLLCLAASTQHSTAQHNTAHGTAKYGYHLGLDPASTARSKQAEHSRAAMIPKMVFRLRIIFI